jgi:hypothetical protein
MTEHKPYWIGGAKDGRFSCQLIPLEINNEPLSTKQLHELITSQALTIDRLLGEVNRYKQAFVDLGECLQKGNYIKAGGIIREMVK